MPRLTVAYHVGYSGTEIRFWTYGMRNSIYAGVTTYAAKGLFRLFVSGKRILKGSKPDTLIVNLTDREAKILKLIEETNFKGKWGEWRKSLEEKKEDFLKRLEEELPVRKLTQALE